jgi:transposase
MTGHNPTDRSKLGKAKRHILTDKKGIPLLVVIPSASTHDIKLVTNVVDNVVIKRPSSYKTKKTVRERRRRKLQHLCLDKAYNSQPEEQELIKRGYVLHIPYKRKRDVKEEREAKITIQHCSNQKKHSAKRWVVERTNSWHNKFRKLLTRYEKKSENYLGLIQLSCCMIIHRKIILG